MSTINFRLLTRDDVEYLQNTLASEKEETRYKLGLLGVDKDKFDSTDWRVCFAAQLGEDLAGIGVVKGGLSTGFNYIDFVYVFPEYRDQGIGVKIVKHLEQYALATWLAVGIDLFTIENSVMEHLVKKAGFECSGVYKNKSYSNKGKFYNESRWYKLYGKGKHGGAT